MKAFEDALAAFDFSEQFRLLADIPAKDHRLLAKKAEETWIRLAEERRAAGGAHDKAANYIRSRPDQKRVVLEAARLIARQSAKKLGFKPSDDLLLKDEVFSLLCIRKPEWLPEVFKGSRKSLGPSPEVTFRYLRAGAIPQPSEGDRYYEAIPNFIYQRSSGRIEEAKRFLRANRELVTHDLPYLIRIAGTSGLRDPFQISPFHINPNDRPAAPDKDFSLMKLVGEMCAAGDFEMSALLRAIMEALGDARREIDAQSVLLAHRELAPVAAERLKVQDSYFALLASPHKNFVRFGVDNIADFRGLPGFDAAGFVDHIAPVFLHKSNPLQLAALKQIGCVVRNHPGIVERVPEQVAHVLLNSDRKVQAAALAVFESLPDSLEVRISDAVTPFADHILASLKPGFGNWLRSSPPSEEPQVLGSELAPEVGVRLEPLASAGDLVFIAGELLNRDPDPMRFELFLDGLARHAPLHRTALEELFAPLRNRALEYSTGWSKNGFAYPIVATFTGCVVLLSSPDNDHKMIAAVKFARLADVTVWPATCQDRVYYGVAEFARSRIAELLEAMESGRRSPLLSTPEFELGFIAPATLVERLNGLSESGLEPLHFDFVQAVARCRMNDDYGNIALPDSESEAFRVVHFLLNGEIRGEIRTPAWWLSAARTREPFGDFSNHPRFLPYHLPDQPDWSVPAKYKSPLVVSFDWCDTIAPKHNREYENCPPNHLYPLQHVRVGNGCDIRWQNSFTPGHLDAAVAHDIEHTYPDLSFGISRSNASETVIEEFARRRLPLRFTMQVHLIVALNSPNASVREAVTDLLIEASYDGRLACAVSGLANVLADLLHGDALRDQPVVQMNRLLPCLRRLSSGSPLLKIQVRDILLHALEKAPPSVPKGFSGLLELILELVLAHPPDRSIDFIPEWGGVLDGKATKLAARIAKVTAL